MRIYWTRTFGPFEPRTTIKLFRKLRAVGCRNVRSKERGTFIECNMPAQKLAQVRRIIETTGAKE